MEEDNELTTEEIIFNITGKNTEDAMIEYIVMEIMCKSIKPINGTDEDGYRYCINENILKELAEESINIEEDRDFYKTKLTEIYEWAINLKKTDLNNNQVTSCANFIIDKLEPVEKLYEDPKSELADRCLLQITDPKERLNLFNDMLKTFDVLIEWSQELTKKHPENKELSISAAFIKEMCNCGIRPPKKGKNDRTYMDL